MIDSLSPFYFLIRIDVICFVMYVNVLKVSITFSQRSKLPCMLLEFVGQMYITGRKEGLETLFSRHQWLLVMNPVVRCLLLVKELQTWKLVSYNIILSLIEKKTSSVGILLLRLCLSVTVAVQPNLCVVCFHFIFPIQLKLSSTATLGTEESGCWGELLNKSQCMDVLSSGIKKWLL